MPCSALTNEMSCLCFQVVSVTITSFDTEERYDFLRIYDGNNTRARLIAELHGTLLSPIMRTSTQRYMFFRFSTDGSRTRRGFSCNYRSVNASTSIPGIRMNNNAARVLHQSSLWNADVSPLQVHVVPL
jgi:hypothetical protein